MADDIFYVYVLKFILHKQRNNYLLTIPGIIWHN